MVTPSVTARAGVASSARARTHIPSALVHVLVGALAWATPNGMTGTST
jgi:hypothetical protein